MANDSKHFYEFGPFRLDAVERQLRRDGEVIPLTPKAFEVLLLLVRNSQHVLKKEEVLAEVWKDSFVEEKNLTDNISTLRKVLGDDPRQPTYIETVTRHGYRFLADVRAVQGNDGNLLLAESTRTRVLIEEDDGAPAIPAERVPLPALTAPKSTRRNITILIALIATIAIGLIAVYFVRKRNVPPAQQQFKSLAVLPLKPLSGAGGDDAYLGQGLADALITKLSNVRQIVVRPTSAVLKYGSGAQPDLKAVAREQQVDAVLDGSFQRAGERLRVTVQLVRASDGAPLWAGTFDERMTDIFAVQDAIAARVTSALALQLTGEEQRVLAKRYTDDTEAYQLYLKGLYHWQTFSPDGLLKSLNFYNAAIERDPKYALAYAGLANSYNVIALYGPLPASEAMEKSRAAALRAVELDGTLAEAHVALGAVKIMHEWDWPGAERELKRALELNRNTAAGHNLYGYYLQAMGRQDEAVEEMKKAVAAAPQWFIVMQDRLESTFGARRYEEAIALSLEALRLEPDDPFALWVLGRSYMMTGRHEQAIPLFERGLKTVAGESLESATRIWLLSGLGYAHAQAGRRGEALKVVARMRESESRWKSLYIAMVLAGLGERDQAFSVLDEAYRERVPFLWQVRFLPEYEALRSDPRYADLLRRMNLSP